MDEQRHRHRELQDMAEAESFYANATWRMYRRITKYRMDHPLPDRYFNDNEELNCDSYGNESNDDPTVTSVTTSDQTISGARIASMKVGENGTDSEDASAATRPFNPILQSDTLDNDDDDEKEDHCKMFELDLS